jgi:acetyl-CoA acetyltransferase
VSRSPVIVGVAQAPLVDGCIPRPATPLSIQAEVAVRALQEAHLILGDVDGLMVSGTWALPGPGPGILPTIAVGEYLGLRPRFMDSTNVGGSSFELFIAHAAMAIEAGYADVVLITYGSLQRSERSRTLIGKPPTLNMQFETPWGLPTPAGSYALAAMRHQYQFGTTSEDLAEIAVAARAWASMNPEATKREPITVDDVMASPMVVDPLHRLDCCLITDGAGAVVVTTEQTAKVQGVPYVAIAGYGEAQSHWTVSQMDDLVVTPAARSGPSALAMAGISVEQVDLLECYDSFTITTLLQLEDLGFCDKGEGGRFVREVGIGPGGGFPVNTHGGGLSYAHPGQYGIFVLIEAVRQLRHESGIRQVPDARVALVNGTGGVLSSTGTCVLVAS